MLSTRPPTSRLLSHTPTTACVAAPVSISRRPSQALSRTRRRAHRHRMVSRTFSISTLNVQVHDSPDAIHAEVATSYGMPQHAPAPPSHHSSSITPTVPNADERGRSHGRRDVAFPVDSTPPPVPPKTPNHDRPKSVKSVSILAPADISPGRRVYSHSVSDSGHSYRTPTNIAVASSAYAPAAPAIFTSHLSSTTNPLAGSLSFSSAAAVTRPSGMEPVTRKASSIRARRNRLQKTRPRPPSPSPTSSAFSSLLSRAFGSSEPLARYHRSSSAPSMGDRSYRPIRSLSDGSSKVALSRPSPSPRSSATDSSCTASSYASTSFSYASTSVTTPDSTSSPGLSPRSSISTNKLKKKRPTLAPSAYQYYYDVRSAALGRSKSTPNGLGQRSPRTRLWSSVEEARHAAEEGDPYGGQDPSRWATSVSHITLLRVFGS